MTSSIIDIHSPKWQDALRYLAHDVYHLPEYFDISSKLEGGSPLAFLITNNSNVLFVPFLIKKLPIEFSGSVIGKDATSPYGYGSPLLSEFDRPEQYGSLLTEMFLRFQSLGLVSVFFRLHPLFKYPLDLLSQIGTLVNHGQTVYIDLTNSEEVIIANFCKNHKRGINKLQRDGYTVVIDEWSYYSQFICLYRETMERVGATKFYFFGNDYFKQLKNLLQKRLHLFIVLSKDKQVAAGGLFTSVDGIVQYHLGATSSFFLNAAPSKLMFLYAIVWSKKNGFNKIHLGGGLGAGNDALFQFKKGFSKSVADFYTWRIIVDNDKYGLLENIHKKSSNKNQNGFFPIYRMP
jgi:hypothetical protein